VERGQWYDQHYPNVCAGFDSTHPGQGDINESLSTLWYHDHRLDHTAQNVYKGLFGFYLLFNDFDTGDETTGWRLPSGPYDVPMVFHDGLFDEETGLLAFDLMNTDGIIGDKFLVNGKIQPFFRVHPRRYRLRWLNVGPSRFVEFFLTDPNKPRDKIRFWQISSDGNLLPRPVPVESTRLAVAERADVVIDFRPFAGKSIYLENRLPQIEGTKPEKSLFKPGAGHKYVRFDVVLPEVEDESRDPSSGMTFYDLPDTAETPLVTRTFVFGRNRGQWTVNGKVITCSRPQFRVKRNSAEKWVIINESGGWEHPVHIHLEEHQILSINGVAPRKDSVLHGRKDVLRLERHKRVELFFRFRDFLGRYPIHCHNVLHEDHSMMLRFDIDTSGDKKTAP
jgi:FtsP/CotA-like multicopper oxidase with cupredoxin domain